MNGLALNGCCALSGLKAGSELLAAYCRWGASSSGWAAFHSRALWIAGGIGGGTGIASPWAWNPFSLARYTIEIGMPSGDVYW